MKDDKGTMSRKEFLKVSSAAILGIGIFGSGDRRASAQNLSKSVVLGKTGIAVNPIGFGASRTMEPSLVDAAIETGFNFLDTGRSYTNGQNEVMIGEVLGSRRKNVVIQSKVKVNIVREEDGSFTAASLKKALSEMRASFDASLRALRTDYIDIFLLHGVEETDIAFNDSIMDFFATAKKEGKIRAHGFSAHINQVELLQGAVDTSFYEVIMVPYNHKGSFVHMNTGEYDEWDQPAVNVELDRAREAGIGLLAMKTCSGGPYSPDGKTPASYEHALRWILQQNKVHALAVAMGSFGEMEENRRALFSS